MQKKSIINKEWDSIFNEYAGKYNLSNCAYSLYLFTERLYEGLKNDKTKDVLFMSREGQFLKLLFDRYCEIKKELGQDVYDVKSHYFYGSRNSIMCASVKSLEEEDFSFLFRYFGFMNASGFMHSIGFSSEQIYEVVKSLGKQVYRKSLNFKASKMFKNLKADAVFRKIYDENRNAQAKAFTPYMQSFNINYEKDGIVFVDIGYHGTMQDLIYKFFNKNVNIKGYYIKSRVVSVGNNLKSGLLSDKANKTLFGERINKYDVFNYEQILRADHGRCLGYEVDDLNVGHPVIDTKLKDKELYDKYVKELQTQILNKFELIAHKSLKDNADISTMCVVYYYYTIKNKSKADYDWLLDMQDSHHDDFGFVGYPGKMFARGLRRFAFKLKDKLFLLKNMCYVRKLKRKINLK